MSDSLPILYGKYLSPYVRRVAVTMNRFGMPYEHRVVSAVGDEKEREAVNPVGRVPALQLPSGEVLIDSAAILDHLDEVVGPDRTLIPSNGTSRRGALRQLSIATGAIDRAMAANAERRRVAPELARLSRLLRQCHQGFQTMEAALDGQDSFNGREIQQTDITIAVGYFFVNHIFPGALPSQEFPKISRLSARCEQMDSFSECPLN